MMNVKNVSTGSDEQIARSDSQAMDKTVASSAADAQIVRIQVNKGE